MAKDIRDTKPESPTSRRGLRLPFFGGILMFVASLVVLAVAAGLVSFAAGWRPSLNPFMKETVDRSSPAVLRSLEDLAEFHASTGHFEVVVDIEKDTSWIPSWVSGERVLFVGVGTIDSVVSFEGLDESRILVSDDGKSATIRLPAPQLEEPRIDLDQSYLYARERGVLNRVGGLFGGQSVDKPVYQKAVEQMRAAAAADGQILALGKKNTTSTLQGILHALGFTSVAVVYEEDEK
jgi:Protein of unknown function (DUF4230)